MNINLNFNPPKGKVKCSLYDPSIDKTVKEFDWTKNLVLNSGLNSMNPVFLVYNPWIPNSGVYSMKAGSGSEPNSFSSTISSVSASQSGDIVTLTGTFAPAASGNVLKYNTGPYAGTSITLISANPNGIEFVTNKSLDIAEPQKFTAWNTSRTELEQYVYTRDSDVSLPLYNQMGQSTTRVNPLSSLYTVRFPISSEDVTIRELGLANNTSNNGTVLTRLVIPEITVPAGLQLQAGYYLEADMTATSGVVDMNITNWEGVSATWQLGFAAYNAMSYNSFDNYIGTLDNVRNKLNVFSDNRPVSFSTDMFNVSGSLLSNATSVDNSNNFNSLLFKKQRTWTLSPDSFNGTVGTIACSVDNSSYRRNNPMFFVLSEPKEKSPYHELTITISQTTNRDIPD